MTFQPQAWMTAFASYEREERDGNSNAPRVCLRSYFERERHNLSRLAGALGDWYAAFSAMMMPPKP